MIPLDVMDQHLAVVGKVGSGKTYCAKGLVERLLDTGRRVCVIDPTGAWWGLQSSADGKRAGFPVVIFGGEHADVPIGRGSGAALAGLVADRNLPAIIDLSEMLIGERHQFMTDFAESLYRRNRQPLHLVIDEADEFCPQNPLPETKRMLHHVDRIVRRGRIRGFRVMLITQRPAVLHKNVLTQANMLVAMRLTAPQDRKAVEDWIRGQGDVVRGREVLDSLAKLQRGEGWVWAPEHDILSRIRFPVIKTFDSSRAPADGEQVKEPEKLVDIDLATIRASLAEAESEAAANDPKALKARIVQLEKELAAQRPVEPDRTALDQARRHGRAEAIEVLQRPVEAIGRALHDFEAAIRDLTRTDAVAMPTTPIWIGVDPASPEPAAVQSPRPRRATSSPALKDRLGAERKILETLAQRHPARLTEAQWATLSGLKRSGGTWNTYKSRLRAAGLIDQERGLFGLTPAGIALFDGRLPSPQGLAETIAMWRNAVGSGPAKILDALIAVYPRGLERDALAAKVALAEKGGTFNTYLSRLRGNGLIESYDSNARLRASEELMG